MTSPSRIRTSVGSQRRRERYRDEVRVLDVVETLAHEGQTASLLRAAEHGVAANVQRRDVLYVHLIDLTTRRRGDQPIVHVARRLPVERARASRIATAA